MAEKSSKKRKAGEEPADKNTKKRKVAEKNDANKGSHKVLNKTL